MSKQTFGDILKQQRQAAGLSQEKLALESGLSSYYIVLLEKGRRQPSLTTLCKLSQALKLTPAVLIEPVWLAYCREQEQSG